MALLTEEQSMLRDATKAWVAQKSPVGAFRKLRDGGSLEDFDPAVWAEMCAMGWAGILVPETYGGSGLGYLTLGLVLEETGRTLTASPLVSTALGATSALLLAGNESQKSEWLPRFARGQAIGAVAVDEGARHAPEKIALKASRQGSGWTLHGKKSFVFDGGAAQVLVVAARTAGAPGETQGVTLFLVPAGGAGVTRHRLGSVDSRGVANVEFDNASIGSECVLGGVDQGFAVLDATLDRLRAGLAAEMLGAATQSFEITLDYLKTRTQFGQAIGTFQSLQHRAAKMFAELELTRSCVEGALQAIDRTANDFQALCTLAKTRANDTWHLVSNEMVQMHGGIGMTDAHDSGLYLKRARVAEAAFGNSAFLRDRYARLQGY